MEYIVYGYLTLILAILVGFHYNVSFKQVNGYLMIYYTKRVVNWNGEYNRVTYSYKLFKIN